MRKRMDDPFEPIAEKERAEWERLIKQGKTLVASRDRSIWKLIIIAGKVQSKYGDSRVQRFADEIGLSKSTMYEYAWLNRAGVTEEFIDKWSALSYTMVREILKHTGKVANPSTEFFLNYAVERKITVRAMQAYMMDTAAPNEARSKASETIKMALQDKQDMEGFSDYLKMQLEKLAEEHPELEDTILRSAIVDMDDFRQLQIDAGLATDEEEKLEGQAKYQTDKIKRYVSHLLTVKSDLKKHIEAGHLNAEDLKFALTRLRDLLNEILEAEFVPLSLPAESVEEVATEFSAAT